MTMRVAWRQDPLLKSLQLPRFLPQTLGQLLGITLLLWIAADRLLLVGFLLPREGPGPGHLQPRFEVARRNHCATVDTSEVGDLAVRRDHGDRKSTRLNSSH